MTVNTHISLCNSKALLSPKNAMSTMKFYPRTSHIVSHHSISRAQAISRDVMNRLRYTCTIGKVQKKCSVNCSHYIFCGCFFLQYMLVKDIVKFYWVLFSCYPEDRPLALVWMEQHELSLLLFRS